MKLKIFKSYRPIDLYICYAMLFRENDLDRNFWALKQGMYLFRKKKKRHLEKDINRWGQPEATNKGIKYTGQENNNTQQQHHH